MPRVDRSHLVLALACALVACRQPPASPTAPTRVPAPAVIPAAPTLAPVVAPEPVAPTPIVLATGCVALDVAAWQERLTSASDPHSIATALAELGLAMPPRVRWGESWEDEPKVERVTVREVELSDAPGPERVIEVAMTATGPERSIGYDAVLVQVLAADAEHRLCLLGDALGQEVRFEERACMDHPVDGAMEGPQILDFVPLTHASHLAIRARTSRGACGLYPRASIYDTSLWEVQGGTLVQVFGPFVTYYESHGAEPHERSMRGTVEITGGSMPRVLRTVSRTLCDPDGVRHEDDGPCRPSTRTQRWRYRDGRYHATRR